MHSIFLEDALDELDEKNEPVLKPTGDDGEMEWDTEDIPRFIKAQEKPDTAVQTSLGEFTSIFYEKCEGDECGDSGRGSDSKEDKQAKKAAKSIKESSIMDLIEII